MWQAFLARQPPSAEAARRPPSLWFFESQGMPLPQVGDLHVVTNWAGEAQCVIRTTRVEISACTHCRPKGIRLRQSSPSSGVPIVEVMRTDRLVLRWLSLEDAEFIYELVNDAEWIRYIGDRISRESRLDSTIAEARPRTGTDGPARGWRG
jgi:hypothetical protein